MELGLQLFGCSRIMAADPDAFFSRVRDFGYTKIEPCVLFGEGPKGLAWEASGAGVMAARAKKYGLTIDSAHVFARDFSALIGEMKAVAGETGIRNFVVGYRGDMTLESVDAFAEKCRETALALAKDNLGLWLHNNREEIAAKIDGVSVYERILRRCAGALGAQVDTGWVLCGGENVNEFLMRNEEYVKSMHHKDVSALPDEKGFTQNCPLGRGLVDTRFAWEFANLRGLTQVVDLDNSAGDFMDDLAQSYKYIESISEG